MSSQGNGQEAGIFEVGLAMGFLTRFGGHFSRRPFAERMRAAAQQIEVVPLAPRRLEQRRLLDAAAAELLLGSLGSDASLVSDYVQTGENLALQESPITFQADQSPSNVQLFLGSETIFENELLQLAVTFDARDVPETHVAVIDWGDGTTPELITLDPGTRFLGTSHRYLDDNPSVTPADINQVKVTISGEDGNFVSVTAPLTVKDLAPAIESLSVTSSLNENDIALLQLTLSDVGTQDTHTVEINWGDGTAVETITVDPGTQFLATSHQYLDDNPSGLTSDVNTVEVKVIDDDGGAATAERSITVSNLAPKIDALSVTPSLNENDVAQLQLTLSDVGTQDTHSVEIHWGDGTAVETIVLDPGARFLATSHQYLDDNPTGTASDKNTVQVKVIDDDGGIAMAQRQVVVSNLAPTIDTLSITPSITEGLQATLSGTFSDVGTQDTFQLDIDWDGNNVFDQTVTVSGGSFSVLRQFLDDNPTATSSDTFDVNVRLRDDDTGVATGRVPLTVNNLAPSVVIFPINSTIDENQVVDLIVAFNDTGRQDSHTIEIDWGDTTPVESIAVPAGGERFQIIQHRYLDDNPSATLSDLNQIQVTVTDDDGGQATANTQVRVNNVAPLLTVTADQVVDEGALLDLTAGRLGSFLDPGTLDTHTATIHWGDGTPTETVLVNQGSGAGTLDGSHHFADNGLYTVTVTLTDDDGGTDVETFRVEVNNVAPRLVVTGDQTVDEGVLLQITDLGTFVDPGFDNPLNTLDPSNGGQTQERFFFRIDWGDGSGVSMGLAPIDGLGSPGVPTTGSFDGSHTYADDGLYTVTVELIDDDGGIDIEAFQVTVNNVDPILVDIVPTPMTTEGTAFTLTELGVSLSDLGFDNPSNPLNPGGSEETFTALTVDWGDGTVPSALSIVDRVSGSPGVPTIAEFKHAPHTYADNGLYTVTIRVGDDDGGVVSRRFKIRVENVAPELTLTQRALEIKEGQTLHLFDLAEFSDPGFNNPLNINDPSNGGEVAETFSYTIDWGDGTAVETGELPATVISGTAGTPTLGTLVDSHQYLDNDEDNLYTITVTLSDDDLGSVTQSIDVTVLNVDPAFTDPMVGDPILATDVNTRGETYLTIEFNDPGTETLTVWVDWGDKLDLPPDQQFVVERSVLGPGIQHETFKHTYDGPPNPLSPASDIIISVFIRDDDFGQPLVIDLGQSETLSVAISNPGLGTTPIVIDTTPQVPRLIFPSTEEVAFFTGASSGDEAVLQTADLRTAVGDAKSTTDRFLELRVIDPATGAQSEGYRLKSEVLSDLPALFRTLPDNHYAIYLVRTETNSRRLVIEVYVRNGKLIDPGDDSEGTRDRPPTEEATTESVEAVRLAPEGPVNRNVDSEEMPKMESQPKVESDSEAATFSSEGSTVSWSVNRRSQMLLGTTLLGLTAQPWAERIGQALASADAEQWRRLRRRRSNHRKR